MKVLKFSSWSVSGELISIFEKRPQIRNSFQWPLGTKMPSPLSYPFDVELLLSSSIGYQYLTAISDHFWDWVVKSLRRTPPYEFIVKYPPPGSWTPEFSVRFARLWSEGPLCSPSTHCHTIVLASLYKRISSLHRENS